MTKIANINVEPKYKNIVSMFIGLTGSKSLRQVYQDSIEMIAMTIQNGIEFYPNRFKRHEEIYKRVRANYSDAEHQKIADIFAEIVRMIDKNPFQDLLGGLYMQLNIGDDRLGQVFTPYDVSRLLAELAYNEAVMKKEIEENGVITINEPCIGGGANAIAMIEVLHEHGINYQKNAVIIGQDISRTAALMAYIVLSLMGCQAVIKIDNTITAPYTNFFDEIRKESTILYTPMFFIHRGFTKGV